MSDWSGEVEVATAAGDVVAMSVADGLRGLEPPAELRDAHARLVDAAPAPTARTGSALARVEAGLPQREQWRAALAEIAGAVDAAGACGADAPAAVAYARRVDELAGRWRAARDRQTEAVRVAGDGAIRRLTRLRPPSDHAEHHEQLVAITRDFHAATRALFDALLADAGDPLAAAAAVDEQQAALSAHLEALADG